MNTSLCDNENNLKSPWSKYYFKSLIIGMTLYTITLITSLILLRNENLGVWQIPIGLAPSLPIFYLVWSYSKALKLMDEFVRHIHIRSILFGAGITVSVSVAVAFFENAGLPEFTFHVWPLMSISWGLALAYNNHTYR